MFIELTGSTGIRHYVNIKHIRHVYKEEGTTMVAFNSAAHFEVKEDYELVTIMIANAEQMERS